MFIQAPRQYEQIVPISQKIHRETITVHELLCEFFAEKDEVNKVTPVLICLLLISGFATAETILDEDAVIGISDELEQAVKSGNLAVFKKYLYPGSKIVVDMDPSNSAGQIEVSYTDYMQLLEMALPLMQEADIHDEIISVSIDEARNQATIREKSTVTMEMMGVKMRDVSISETVYGIVNGQIKALSATDQLISSEAVE